MRVQVKQLRPNPYRRMENYPINREKVEALKASINETSFWDNILARPSGKEYEIAYGHHRLIALQELGMKEVEIPIRELPDSVMIQVMANENLTDWTQTPAVINETVLAAKDYLDAELAKCESWEQFKSSQLIKISDGCRKEDFARLKEKGVGRDTIVKFLGKNWEHKGWMVQEALAISKPDTVVDKEAFESFSTMEQAKHFKAAVKVFKVPKDKQKRIAKVLAKEGTGKRNISSRVVDLMGEERKKIPATYKAPQKPKLDDAVINIINIMQALESQFISITKKLGSQGILHYVSPTLKEKFIKAANNLTSWIDAVETAPPDKGQIAEGEN